MPPLVRHLTNVRPPNFEFLDVFYPVLQAWMQEHRQTGREFVICGDWNIAHTEKDLKNWKGNLKTPASCRRSGPGLVGC